MGWRRPQTGRGRVPFSLGQLNVVREHRTPTTATTIAHPLAVEAQRPPVEDGL